MKQIVLNIRNGEKNTDIAFPCVEEELGKALASIGLVNTPSPKAYVTEVVEPDALCLLESKVVDLDEVNYLAKLMDSEDETEKNTLFAVTACEGYDTSKELINLHFNLGCYTLVQPTDDAEAVGRRYMYSMKPCMTMTEVEFMDRKALFSDTRLKKNEIPEGLYRYELRDRGDGEFCTVEKEVVVNHAGTLLMKEPLDLGESGYIELDEETGLNFLGYDQTMQEFMTQEKQEEEQEEGGITQ